MVETSSVGELRAGELQIASRVEPASVHLVWQGRSTARDPRSVLVPYFEQAFVMARKQGASVEMHFEGLGYCNSSTIAALIDSIRIASEHGVSVVMTYKREVRWQRMSFDVLRAFEKDHTFQLRAV